MSTTLSFDAKAAAQVEAVYSTPDVAATRIAAFRAGGPAAGQTVADIGCGPGYLLKDLGAAVGAGGAAIGIDISDPMLAIAKQRCADLPNVRVEKADALHIPVADGALDLATVLQVYAYVREIDAALAELARATKPGGRVVILDTDFDGIVWESADRARMARVLTAYDGHVAWPDLPRILPRRLRAAGFKLDRCETVPILTTAYHPQTYVYGLARFIHRFVTERANIPVAEADAWLAEFDALEAEKAFLFAASRFLFVATRV